MSTSPSYVAHHRLDEHLDAVFNKLFETKPKKPIPEMVKTLFSRLSDLERDRLPRVWKKLVEQRE